MASTLSQLLRAIQAGQTQDVRRILGYNPSLAHARQARDGHTPLHVASATGNLAIVRELLQGGARCQETDSNLEVPLHIAARQRNGAAVVKELIADAGRRSCLKSMNRDGATPLHLAVQAGLLDIVQLLVNAGSKVDATDRSGRTPLDYVDPRLPGLAEVLETGRQLTPVRATSRTSSKHKASPYHSPAAPIAAYRGPAAPPSPSGHNMSTPQRRSSSGGHVGSGYSSWETSPTPHQQHRALSPQGQQFAPVERRHGDSKQAQRTPQGRHNAGGLSREPSAAREPGGPAAEGSSASLASPKPPRQHSSHTAGAAVTAAGLQQQLASPVRSNSSLVPSGALQDSSSTAHCTPAADEPPASAQLRELGHDGLQEGLPAINQAADNHTPGQSLQYSAAEAAGTPAVAVDHQQDYTPAAEASEGSLGKQQQGPARGVTHEAASGTATPPAGTIEAATAHFVQQQQQQVAALAAGAWGSAGGAAVEEDSGAAVSSVHALQKQQQQQQSGSSNAAAPPAQQEMLQGPLQQQAPTALPPATLHPAGGGLVAPPASAAAGAAAPAASAAGAGVYCRGPLSLAQPQMQPMAVAAGLAGSAGPGSIGAHYQQLAAATIACQQSLQQLQGNVNQLAVFRSSSNVAAGSLGGVPMGPLRSGRVAAAAAAAGESSRGPPDPLAGPACFAGSTGGSAVFKGGLGHGGADMYGVQRRHSSSNNGMAGANSWIVTPEASSGLLGASLVAGSSTASHVEQGQPGHASSNGGHAAVSAAAGADAGLGPAGPAPADEAAGDSKQQHQLLAEHPHGPIQVSKADTAAPPAVGASATATNPPNSWTGERSHPVLAAAQQLHRQQQQLAGIAAAVAASGAGSGPLQAPLLAQLGELSGKVARLEDWFEAQVELIPDWQKALEVVQAVKRQADDHSHLLTEQDGKLANQASFIMDLAGKVDGLDSWSQTAQEGSSKQDQSLAQLKADQAGLRCYLAEFELRMQQLQDQVALQAAAEGDRAAAGEAQVSSLVSQLDDTNSRLDAAAARLSSLESTAVEAKQQLLEQQQAVAAATALAAAAAERSAAAEVAAATAAAGGNDGSGSSRSRSSIVAHKPCGSNAQQALLTESLTKQLADLKLQFAELSAAVSNMSRASRVAAAFSRKHSNESQSQDLNQGPSEAAGALVLRPLQGAEGVTDSGLGGDHELPPEYDESWLPFMESTSACLASHEQQLEALQSLVPKLEGVVSQRAQLINMAEQLAALQTAFNMLSHSHSRSTSQGGGAVGSPLHALVPAGPLGAHKAAADTLSLATSMVKLQGQMGQLTLAVEGLRDEWEEAADAVRGEREAIRRDWEAERARIAAAESEVARLLSEQQAEFAEREERLIQIRAAASDADDAARVAALEAQQHFASQLAGLQAQQALLAQQLAAAHASNDALRAELTAVQGKLAATADAQAAMAEAQAATAAAAAATAAMLQQPAVEHAGVQHEAAATATAAVQAGGDTIYSIWQAPAADPSCNSIITADCNYPHVRQLASPADNPFLVDSLAPAAAPAALAAAAAAAEEGAAVAAEASAASLALSGEPSAELAVLGQQRLVSSSVFGAAYWGTTDARRSSSDNCSLQSPSSSVMPLPAAAELGEQRRRMTYDAAVPVGSDRDSRGLQGSSTAGSFFAGHEPAAPGASVGAVRQGVRVTDTYPASTATAAAMLVPAGAAGGSKKKGWLSKVRLGHSSGGSKAAAGLQQQHQLEVVDVAQAAKRSAGGALFGRWSKHAKAAAVGPQVQGATCRSGSSDNWPSMMAASGAATDSRAAGQQGGLRGSSTAGRDTKGGSDSDQLAACGAATRTLGYRAAVQPPPPAATAGSEQQSGSKWKRRLLGKSSKV